MSKAVPFAEAGRVPEPGDNVAIAIRRLEAGLSIDFEGGTFLLSHTVLEGHRFAIALIPAGQPLLSWGLPFGVAARDIRPGEYVANGKILTALGQRHVPFPLPQAANFEDRYEPCVLSPSGFVPGRQVERYPETRTFAGYAREGGRGVGTRNHIVVLGTTSLTSGYARAVAERFHDLTTRAANIDGVVAVAHTEGGGTAKPHNLALLLRTLAGFLVHPNVAAVLALDLGTGTVTNAMLEDYARDNGYPLDSVIHRFLTLKGGYQSGVAEAERIVRQWIAPVDACRRTAQSIEHLKMALQCGGSDAFSGVSGNPLAGWVAREIIRWGGSANLAETDELIGAEPYVLSNVRDLETARAFLRQIERFQEWAGWHGHGAEFNPSGGNLYRGLYNIAIKSIGAARKKDPAVRLDYVLDYGAPMTAPGFYFMDSPGNDLESIAGQVASGCNLTSFITGNGSITNFPFVPTLKIVTTSDRYRLLSREMDVNAGRYLDGMGMDKLGAETFELTLRIAAGERSAGEKAGHSQVQIWREWRQTDGSRLDTIRRTPRPSGEPLPVRLVAEESLRKAAGALKGQAMENASAPASARLGLIVPTSLCAGQVGQLIAGKLNQSFGQERPAFPRFVALPHTEGCGVSEGDAEELLLRTLAGYTRHPLVGRALLLEHGCEKTHNDAFRNFMEAHGIPREHLGWASIQLDGGIEKVTAKVAAWFRAAANDSRGSEMARPDTVRLGITSAGHVPKNLAKAAAALLAAVLDVEGSVVIPANASLLAEPRFNGILLDRPLAGPTLAYGEPVRNAGFHVMETPTDHQVETLTGLGATGVEVMIAFVGAQPLQAHPLVPLLQVGHAGEDLDFCVGPEASALELAEELLRLATAVLAGDYTPKLAAQGNSDFQMTRSLLGVSL